MHSLIESKKAPSSTLSKQVNGFGFAEVQDLPFFLLGFVCRSLEPNMQLKSKYNEREFFCFSFSKTYNYNLQSSDHNSSLQEICLGISHLALNCFYICFVLYPRESYRRRRRCTVPVFDGARFFIITFVNRSELYLPQTAVGMAKIHI